MIFTPTAIIIIVFNQLSFADTAMTIIGKSKHIKKIVDIGELSEKSTLQKMQIANSDRPVVSSGQPSSGFGLPE